MYRIRLGEILRSTKYFTIWMKHSIMSDKELFAKFGFEETIIPEQRHYDGLPFPLVVKPAVEKNVEEWSKTVRDNRKEMEQLLHKYGAILFVDFPMENPESFDKFIGSFGWGHYPYLGFAPRRHIVGNVYTANEAPPDSFLSFHHEMRYQPHVPDWVSFYCDLQPYKGGETPIAMSYPIYEDMAKREPEFVEKLEKEGMYFTRVQPGKIDDSTIRYNGSWQDAYFTANKEEVEKIVRSHGSDVEWLDNGCARISCKMEAFGTDSQTGKKTWFNNSLAFYFGSHTRWNDPKKTIFFGNREPMPDKAMKTLQEVFESHAVDYKWVKGRVVLMDNYRVLHARRTFKPPRRIMASVWKGKY